MLWTLFAQPPAEYFSHVPILDGLMPAACAALRFLNDHEHVIRPRSVNHIHFNRNFILFAVIFYGCEEEVSL